MVFEAHNGEFTVSTDPGRLDLSGICSFLAQTYWAKNRPREVMEKAIRHSLCFGVFHGERQIGFARAITDYATVGYLADVYILDPYRRRGLGRWLVTTILSHPELKHLRRWMLLTQDMQELYRQCGFRLVEHPEECMERLRAYPEPCPQTAKPAEIS